MTQPQTWPLGREAVEAAAREMLAYFSDPDDVPHSEDLNAAARALRAALAAWEPSEGQWQAARSAWTEDPGGMLSGWDKALLAAVRTEVP